MTDTLRCAQTPLGERAVDYAHQLMREGKHEEPPGSNAGPFVAMLFAPAKRNGKPVGITRGDWCAVFACHCVYHVAEGRESPLMPYVVSGIELENWAKGHQRWIPVEEARNDVLAVHRGDLCILRRGDPRDAANAWKRHVCLVDAPADDGERRFRTVGGNEHNRIASTTRDMHDPALLGFIAMPRE